MLILNYLSIHVTNNCERYPYCRPSASLSALSPDKHKNKHAHSHTRLCTDLFLPNTRASTHKALLYHGSRLIFTAIVFHFVYASSGFHRKLCAHLFFQFHYYCTSLESPVGETCILYYHILVT